MEEEKKEEELDLQAILKQAESKTDFPEVTFDEFTPPTDEEWKVACEALLKGAPFEKVMFTKTYEGITFDPMYTRKHTEDILPKASYPGMGDYLRGTNVSGYVGKPWGIAQSCDETLPKENNELLKFEVEKGSTVYNVRLDKATLLNKDVKDAEKVGDDGCSVTTLDDIHTLLDGLKLDEYPLYIYAGASALPMLAGVAAKFNACGKKLAKLTGFVGADPIGQLVENGQNYASLDQLYNEMAETAKWAIKNAPSLRTIMVRDDVFSRGGASDVQDTAYVLAIAVEYIRQLMKRGLTIKEAASQIFFGISMGANFFMQIAKLRASRPIWANIIKAFGGDEEDMAMHVHGRPALFFKTVFDPYVNMLRNTTEIFSGVVGGLDSYENEPFDEPIRKGDVFSRRIARNVQVMLQEEFGLLQPIDPSGGSWAVETLTKQIKEKIWAEFQAIEGKGGIVKALEEGYPQETIAKTLADRFKALEFRKDRIVGSNMYPNMTEELLDKREEDQAALKKQRQADIDAYLSDMDDTHKAECLKALKDSATVDTALKAFQAGATIGEIRAALNKGGASETLKAIAPHRWSERFEDLRMTTEAFKKAHNGDNVKVFLANMGPIPQHKARADFSTSFLQVGEFDVELNNGFKTTDEAAAAAKESGADVAVICSTDKTYPEIVPDLAPKLRAALPNATIYLAGAAPKDLEPVYREAGVDDFISVKANCYEILRFLQKKKGMID
ncbi:MAG: methylmalonyl-CoA mutase [Schwartzia succinivorans]|jgi:methylmalonyl-CoA mutase|uniref:methylmalonyl-CoA mutase family protein n=1 Tax=Schwartzia succinivorans TaxID=55507 RepID=UPI0023536BCC|nr:methylmalonyl-CoA mutase family protein [Schwartzia succinivorans]MBE6097839.1 methylmalonyl-CoA mutase [Schwartzia succinivorans]